MTDFETHPRGTVARLEAEKRSTTGRAADALADAVDLLEEFLPADHAALVRIQNDLAAVNVAMLRSGAQPHDPVTVEG